MSKKLLTLIFGLLIVAAIVYVYYLNPETVTVRLTTENPTEVPLAVVIIGAFCSGLLLSAVVAFYFGIKQKIQLWSLTRQLKQGEAKIETILAGRARMRAGDFRAAENAFLKLVTRDPEDLLSRLHLVETLTKEGDINAALDTLNEFRRERLDNLELLFLGADLNAELSNFTAAADNAQLALQLDAGNAFALKRLALYCEKLGRFDEAVSYQREFVAKLSGEEEIQAQEHLARLEVIAAQKKYGADETALVGALEETLRRHRECPEALVQLGKIALKNGDIDGAVKRLVRAYKRGHSISALESAVAALLKGNKPQKVLALLNSITSEKSSITQYTEAHLLTLNVLLHLEMLEDAAEHLEKLLEHRTELSRFENTLNVLQARLMREQGKQTDAFFRLSALVETLCDIPGRKLFAANEKQLSLLPTSESSETEESPSPQTLGLPGPK